MKLKEIFQKEESRYTIPQMLRWLWQAWRGNRLQATLNATVGLLGVGCSLASVWAMKRAIDTASGVQSGSVYWAVAIMAAIILAEFALGISRVWIKNILGIKAQNRMQQSGIRPQQRHQLPHRDLPVDAQHADHVCGRVLLPLYDGQVAGLHQRGYPARIHPAQPILREPHATAQP